MTSVYEVYGTDAASAAIWLTSVVRISEREIHGSLQNYRWGFKFISWSCEGDIFPKIFKRVCLFSNFSLRLFLSFRLSEYGSSTLYGNIWKNQQKYTLKKAICECVEKKNQLDATEWFIALIIWSKCFGHFYAHHQELETICVLVPPMVGSAWLLVVGGRLWSSRLCVQKEGCCTTHI